MANKRVKRCSTSCVIREMQIRTKRYQHTRTGTVKTAALTASDAGEGVEQQEVSFIASGNAKRHSHLGGHLVVSYKTEYTLI